MRAALLVLAITVLSAIPLTPTAQVGGEGITYLTDSGWVLLDSEAGPSYIEVRLPADPLAGATNFHVSFELAVSAGEAAITLRSGDWVSEELVIGRDHVGVGGEEYPIFADAGVGVVIDAWQGWAATAMITLPDGAVAYSIDIGRMPSTATTAVLRVEARGRLILRDVSYYSTGHLERAVDEAVTHLLTYRFPTDMPVRGGYARLAGDVVGVFDEDGLRCVINLSDYSGGGISYSHGVFTDRPWVWWETSERTYWVGEVDPGSCGLANLMSLSPTSLPEPKKRVTDLIPLWAGAVYVDQSVKGAIIDTGTGEALNITGRGFSYVYSNTAEGVAVFKDYTGTFIIRKGERDLVLEGVRAYQAASAGGRILLRTGDYGDNLLLVEPGGGAEALNIGEDLRIMSMAGFGDTFAFITYSYSDHVYRLVLASVNGEVVGSEVLGRSGAFAFGPGDGHLVLASLSGGYLNVSVIEGGEVRSVYSIRAPPVRVGAILPAWDGVLIMVRPQGGFYAYEGGLIYRSNEFGTNIWVVDDSTYWVSSAGVAHLMGDVTAFYPWSRSYGEVWVIGDRAMGAYADINRSAEWRPIMVQYDVFTPPDNVRSERAVLNVSSLCGRAQAVMNGPSPTATALYVSGDRADCLGIAGEFLQPISSSLSNYVFQGVWAYGDEVAALFSGRYGDPPYLLAIATAHGSRVVNLTRLAVDSLGRRFGLFNVSKILITPSKLAYSPDGSGLAIEFSARLIGNYGGSSLTVFDTLVLEAGREPYLVSSLLPVSRLLMSYPIRWVSRDAIIVGNPPLMINLSGKPSLGPDLGPYLVDPESAIIPFDDTYLAAYYTQSPSLNAWFLLLSEEGSRIYGYGLPVSYRVTFSELIPAGKYYVLLVSDSSNYPQRYYAASVHWRDPGLDLLKPYRVLVGPDGVLRMDCYSACNAALITEGGGTELRNGSSVSLEAGKRYALVVGGDSIELEPPSVIHGVTQPTGEPSERIERAIIEGHPYCASLTWAKFGRRVEIYDGGILLATIPYPDTWPLRSMTGGSTCLNLTPGTHHLRIVYREATGKIVKTTGVELEVVPSTGVLQQAQIGVTTTGTTSTTVATATTGAPTTTTPAPQPSGCGLVCVVVIAVVAVALAALTLWVRWRKRK